MGIQVGKVAANSIPQCEFGDLPDGKSHSHVRHADA